MLLAELRYSPKAEFQPSTAIHYRQSPAKIQPENGVTPSLCVLIGSPLQRMQKWC
jgi:hypothetical protein